MHPFVDDSDSEDEVGDSADQERLHSESEEDGFDCEEETSETPALALKGKFLPGCYQKHSCGCCPATKESCKAPSKSNYELAKKALQFDVRTSEVSENLEVSCSSYLLNDLTYIISFARDSWALVKRIARESA
jgi:hypothetical protein